MASLWLAALVGCEDELESVPPAPEVVVDPTHFENYCAPCHQMDGLGMEETAPPLVGSPWVKGPESRLIRIVLHGVAGPLEVGDTTFNLEMPAFGEALSDEDIAAMLSYVRKTYGDPSPPVTAAAVGQVRAETVDRTHYWTVEELLKVP